MAMGLYQRASVREPQPSSQHQNHQESDTDCYLNLPPFPIEISIILVSAPVAALAGRLKAEELCWTFGILGYQWTNREGQKRAATEDDGFPWFSALTKPPRLHIVVCERPSCSLALQLHVACRTAHSTLVGL